MSCIVVFGVACGGGDDADSGRTTDGGDATIEQPDGAADDSSAPPAGAAGYDLPDDYPLPTPEGGTLLSALFDETSETSNVVIAYPSASLDGLIERYDEFFDTVDGETVRVPPTDGLASWQNQDAGYSVIVNGQNADVQVRLQTGV